jgi:hypothetical protein
MLKRLNINLLSADLIWQTCYNNDRSVSNVGIVFSDIKEIRIIIIVED